MYVRLGFRGGRARRSRLLLIDEVLSVGDEEFSAKCIAKIQEMKYRGVTLVFVTTSSTRCARSATADAIATTPRPP